MADLRVFRLTLVRHGQTTHNREHILQGQLDTQLTELGREQARLLGKYFARYQMHYDQVFSSDLGRAHETCSIVCGAGKNQTSIGTSQLLRERSYGALQGIALERLREMAYKLGHDRNNLVTGGETVEEVQQRIKLFCSEHLFPLVKDRQHVLVVSHASTIREFTRLLGRHTQPELAPGDIVVTPNTAINSFDIQLRADNEINQIKIIHLHQIPHLTFDVFNRDNPHPELKNARTLTSFGPKLATQAPTESSANTGPTVHCTNNENSQQEQKQKQEQQEQQQEQQKHEPQSPTRAGERSPTRQMGPRVVH